MKKLFETSSKQTRAHRGNGIWRPVLIGLLMIVAAAASVSQVNAQANNHFTNALTLDPIGTPGTLAGSSLGATRETNEPIHWVGSPNSARSVWFSWTATETGIVTFDTFGSAFDTILAAYIQQGTNGLASLTQLASDDDSGSLNGSFFERTSVIRFPVTQGTNYFIAIDGYRTGLSAFNDSGPYVLNWRIGTNPPVQPGTIRFSNPSYTVFENGGRATISVPPKQRRERRDQ